MNSPLPSLACEPAASSRPPITKVGSMPASASTLAIRLVVVVLPCVPGDRDALAQAHQLREHQRARDDRECGARARARLPGCRA